MSDIKPYECTLSADLIKKAELELKEKPEWRSRDIQALREMVLKNKGLKCPTNDEFLLRFLRARKFDYDRSYELLLNFYRQRNENTDIYDNFKPSSVKHILEAGVTGILNGRDEHGRRILVFRPGRWNPDGSMGPLADVMKTNILSLMHVIKDEETQINGIVVVGDMSGLTMAHARHIVPNVRRISGTIQDSLPVRLKGIHYVNEPTIISYIFSFMKPFLREKIQKRIFFHSQDWDGLHEHISKDILPSDFGGQQEEHSNKEWMELLLGAEEEYLNEKDYGLTESAPVFKEVNKDDAMECLSGTYRKLNVD